MNELYFKMAKHDIKLEVETMKDELGHDSVMFVFTTPVNRNGKRRGVITVFYLDQVTSNLSFVIERLNETLDRFIDKEIQHNLNQ